MSKTILKNSPISYVVAQLTFPSMPANPNMENQIVQLHERIRKEGFPNRVDKKGKQVRLTDSGVEFSDVHAYSFLSLDKTTSVHLSSDTFVLETSKYDGYDKFISTFNKSLNLVNEIFSIVGMDRVGIRFINLIDPSADALSDLIKPDLIALEEVGDAESIKINYMESRRSTGEGQELIIKVTKSKGGAALPDEFANPHIKMTKTRTAEYVTALLDFDHIKIYDGAELDTSRLLSDMDMLHKKIYEAFYRSVTNKAIKDWS
ncbi:TIGR04255 family protein [Rheinheimera sp. FR7-31]|uniref:TIGR04255 family protein n=1 Tax=Rheinheimera fenheensis TaxID=3152295 RepID=UPI00325E84F9